MPVTPLTWLANYIRLKTQGSTPATPASGYSIIYEEGGALKLKDDAGTITTFGASTVSDTAYDATSWNGVTTIAPSKNAVRDKIEDMVSDTAYGAGWDGVTTIAPSKNAVYDKINSLASGTVIQVKNYQTSASSTTTTTIPADDTIPQNTEGAEFMTLAITPTSATNVLDFIISITGTYNQITTLIAALFQDSTANALATNFISQNPANGLRNWMIIYSMVAGTTSATTFKVRVGGGDAGTFTFNGAGGNRVGGGVCYSSITITERTP